MRWTTGPWSRKSGQQPVGSRDGDGGSAGGSGVAAGTAGSSPVVPVAYVERERTQRSEGTAARCLATKLPLPDLLDEAYEHCYEGVLRRIRQLIGEKIGTRNEPVVHRPVEYRME